jgi:hypothetical protein
VTVQARTRRHLDKVFITGGSLAVGAVALVGGVVGNTEHVERYWTTAALADDGAARVTEVIDYDFGNATDGHGVFRWVPGLTSTDEIDVSSPDAPAGTQLTREVHTRVDGTPVDGLEIRIGDAGTTVSGRHRYEVGYDLPAIRRGDVVDWEAVGTGWEVGIDEAEIHLVTPFELDDVVCTSGTVGSTDPCDVRVVEPGHVTMTVDGLDAGEGVSVEGRVGATLAVAPPSPAAPADPPADPGTGLLPPAGVAAAAAAVAAVPATLLVRRAGRERVAAGGPADAAFAGGPPLGGGDPWPAAPTDSTARSATSAADWSAGAAAGSPAAVPPPPPMPGAAVPTVVAETAPASWPRGEGSAPVGEVRLDADELAQMATTEFAPPSGISPAHGGIVLREDVRHEHKVAWLVQAAIDGAIDIDDGADGRGGTRLHRVGGAPASAEQQAVLGRMFAAGPDIELGRYDKDFAAGWGVLGAQLGDWRHTSGLWDTRADSRRVVGRVLGIVAALAGAVVTIVGGGLAASNGAQWLPVPLAGGVIAGAGLAVALGAWELHVRTPAGSAVWLRVESFRRFLAASEAYHAEEAAKRGILREYTAWAIAVGEIDRWSRAVSAASIPPEVAGVHYAYMAPLLLASTTSTATAPSSSGGAGGGGFGGGSVGGGAGGGGGGSW